MRWLSDHVEELIGEADLDPDLEAPGGGTVSVHEPDPCCHNDSRIFLAVWADGPRVITLEIAGQAAQASDVAEPASKLDAAGVMTRIELASFGTVATGLDHPEGVTVGPDGLLYAGGEAGQVYRIGAGGKSRSSRRPEGSCTE